MANTAKRLVEIAKAEIGYCEKATNSNLDNPSANAGSNNWTKYARDLASAGYYNGNKNGYAWCDVFVDWCFFKLCGSKSVAEKLECQTGDLGAGCKFSMQYYQNQGRFDKNPKVGDQIFFRYSGNTGADHTGIVVEVTSSQIITVEGNSGDKVKQNTYSRSYACILGYGHPKFDSEPTTQPVSQPKDTTVKGIDVSKWQGEIDWNKVKADGIKFAMIRLGYGSADGTQCGVDSYFKQNVANAVKAGVDVGCYFYSYALTVEAAKKEAQFVVNILKDYKGVFTYPIAFDLEDPKQQSLGKTILTNMIIAFGDIIEKAGYWCSLYSNLNWLTNILDDTKLTRFDHWVAQWASACTYKNKDIMGMWQSSSTGKVNGINGNVDTDVAYKDYPTIIKQNKLNGFTSATQKPVVPVVNTPTTSEKPTETVKPATPNVYTPKVGDRVTIVSTKGVKYNPNSSVIPDWVKKDTHIVTQITSNGKDVIKGGKKCVLLGKKLNQYGSAVAGINTWVAVDLLLPIGATEKDTKQYTTYTVKAGDSLWAIAARFLGSGSRYKEIKTLNNLATDVIYVGTVLKIPNK